MVMKNYENQKSPTLHFGWYFESGSNFKAVKFSIYPNHMLKEDTHKNYIVQ